MLKIFHNLEISKDHRYIVTKKLSVLNDTSHVKSRYNMSTMLLLVIVSFVTIFLSSSIVSMPEASAQSKQEWTGEFEQKGDPLTSPDIPKMDEHGTFSFTVLNDEAGRYIGKGKGHITQATHDVGAGFSHFDGDVDLTITADYDHHTLLKGGGMGDGFMIDIGVNKHTYTMTVPNGAGGQMNLEVEGGEYLFEGLAFTIDAKDGAVSIQDDTHNGGYFKKLTIYGTPNKCPKATGISKDGLGFIEKQEGYAGVLKGHAKNDYGFYNDQSGFCTVGYGHLIGKRACNSGDYNGPYSNIKTQADAEQLLKNDMGTYQKIITDNVKVSLSQQQFDSMASLVFNIGETNFKKSQVLKDLNDGNYDAIPQDLMKHVYSKGKVLQDLVNRRTTEGKMFSNGKCQTSQPTTPSSQLDLMPMPQTVQLAGNYVNIDLDSSSTISNFNVNEGNKQISFNIDGDNGGTIMIPVGMIMNGPYAIMVDGKNTMNFDTVEDLGNDEEIVALDYNHIHSVTINGSSIIQNTGNSSSINPVSISVPSWIKRNAGWWADGSLSDDDFVKGMQYLIQQGIITLPTTQSSSNSSQEIPSWIKKNAGWWADGSLSDDDFVKGIQYLIAHGIIKIKN